MAIVGQNINGYTVIRELTIGVFCSSYKVQKAGVSYFMKEYKAPISSVFVDSQKRVASKLKLIGGNVERIVDSFEIECQYYHVKEFIEGVNLKEWMATHTNPIVRWAFAVQMCEIVTEIHNKGIIHQDLKPTQFMVVVDDTNECGFSLVLTDFDWSVVDGIVVKKVGTLYYSNIDRIVSRKTDTLSLGIILSELLVGRKPHNIDNINIFESVDDANAYWNNLVLNKDFTAPRLIAPTNITSSTSDVIVRCIDPKAENRPDVEEIIKVLKSDKDRFNTTTKSISAITPDINMCIRVSAIKPAPTLGVKMAFSKVFKRMSSRIEVMDAVHVNIPKVSLKYHGIKFHIPSTRMLHCDIANFLKR